MNRRRLLVMAVLLALTAAIVGTALTEVAPGPAGRFAQLTAPTTPYVPLNARLTSTFFCPGVPAAAADGTGGQVVVVNPTEAALDGEISVFGVSGPLGTIAFELASRTSRGFDVGGLAAEGYAVAMVELRGTGAVVEQQAVLPEGTSVAPCTNDAAVDWTAAAGSTLGDRYQLVLSNPYADAAVVELEFATATETRTPNEFSSFVVPSRSVRVIDVDQVARDEAQLSITVLSRRGGVVVGRALRFGGGERSGASVALAAPGADRQWLFADGEIGEGIEETFTIVNTGAGTASVDLSFFPAVPVTDTVIAPVSTEVAPGRAVVVSVAALAPGFTGRYGASVAAAGDARIVVEHQITRPTTGTSMSLGSRFGSGRWWAPIGVAEPTGTALVVFNASGLAGTVSVSALGPGGTQPLPGLEDLPVAGAATFVVDLPPESLGDPILVESETLSLVVQQWLPAGNGRRSGGLGVPE